MTAPVDQQSFAVPASEPWPIVLALWRGAMIERFSRSEALVLKCLILLRDRGFALPADAFADGAPTRARRLAEFLETEDFGGSAKPTRKLLPSLAMQAEHRPAIAHGAIRRHARGVRIEWTCCRGAATRKVRDLDLFELVAELTALDKTTRDLSSQIGQICRAIELRAAQPL